MLSWLNESLSILYTSRGLSISNQQIIAQYHLKYETLSATEWLKHFKNPGGLLLCGRRGGVIQTSFANY